MSDAFPLPRDVQAGSPLWQAMDRYTADPDFALLVHALLATLHRVPALTDRASHRLAFLLTQYLYGQGYGVSAGLGTHDKEDV
jgi:hypothetical protein